MVKKKSENATIQNSQAKGEKLALETNLVIKDVKKCNDNVHELMRLQCWKKEIAFAARWPKNVWTR